MMSQSFRASRSILTRVVRQQATASQRAFTVSATPRADLIQDLYLKELRAYKPVQAKASDAEAHVQKFSAPKAPKSPEENDLQSGLKAYEDSVVEIEGQSGEPEEAVGDWFEEEPETASQGGH